MQQLKTLLSKGAGGPQTFRFDAADNQTQIADDGILDSGYDVASRLAFFDATVTRVENRYDGRGFLERSERTYPGALFADGFEGGNAACWDSTVGGGGGGSCPVDPLSVNPTYSSDGLLHHLVRGLDDHQRWVIYHAGRPVAMVEQRGSGAAEITYLTVDHLGTPVLAMDDAGLERWEGGFEPFGGDFSDAGGAGVFLRFPGQWVDGLMAEGGAYNVHRWYQPRVGKYSRLDPLGLAEDDWTLYGYAIQNPNLNIDPEGLVALGPGQKCKPFNRAKRKLEKLKQNCECLNHFEQTLGGDLKTLIDGPLPNIMITPVASASGRSPCDGNGTIEINVRFCRLGGRRALANIILHELAHFADCQQQRFPPGGSIEEGAEAERSCFGFSLDSKVP